ncbi:uncharacterized protein LAESUDRAFT_746722 [Laetiporus sulphureus 93-53]|uniref:Uncharacterized protein n=1 Tax=Laetiporus sulphureus 93-53 TaxID=1314785 RepID=A0A165HML3_9APHY|nr:uncharacterized protein LAESUDRAFT_746722 [Laetiporus sulphureus 93-53]KZT11933.1 hypothetical protein LAESUDRAFT_746722 [Laetiporus sulphureus 93-53]
MADIARSAERCWPTTHTLKPSKSLFLHGKSPPPNSSSGTRSIERAGHTASFSVTPERQHLRQPDQRETSLHSTAHSPNTTVTCGSEARSNTRHRTPHRLASGTADRRSPPHAAATTIMHSPRTAETRQLPSLNVHIGVSADDSSKQMGLKRSAALTAISERLNNHYITNSGLFQLAERRGPWPGITRAGLARYTRREGISHTSSLPSRSTAGIRGKGTDIVRWILARGDSAARLPARSPHVCGVKGRPFIRAIRGIAWYGSGYCVIRRSGMRQNVDAIRSIDISGHTCAGMCDSAAAARGHMTNCRVALVPCRDTSDSRPGQGREPTYPLAAPVTQRVSRRTGLLAEWRPSERDASGSTIVGRMRRDWMRRLGQRTRIRAAASAESNLRHSRLGSQRRSRARRAFARMTDPSHQDTTGTETRTHTTGTKIPRPV